MKDLFDISNRPTQWDNRTCPVCATEFTPSSVWEKRCNDCRVNGRKADKVLPNINFTGQKTVPQGIRLYPAGNGKKYPSVTSILHPKGIDYPLELLEQYASRGTLIHKKIEHFLNTGNYPTLKELCEHYPDMLFHVKRMKQGSLGLDHKQCNFLGFYQEYGQDFTFDEIETKLVSHEHEYAGTTDCIGTYKKERAIIDYKTASDYGPERLGGHFVQLSAYARATGISIKYLIIIGLNPQNPKGYEPPMITEDVDGNFNKFLIKRAEFRKMYGY